MWSQVEVDQFLILRRFTSNLSSNGMNGNEPLQEVNFLTSCHFEPVVMHGLGFLQERGIMNKSIKFINSISN